MPREATGTVVYRKGRWYARVSTKDATGKTVRPWVDLLIPDAPDTPKGKAIAQARAREVAALARDRTFAPGEASPAEESPGPETIGQLAERWFTLLERDAGGKKVATLDNYKTRMAAHVLPAFKDTPPPLAIPAIREFLRDLKSKRSGSTVRNVAYVMTKFLDACEAEGWTEGENPMRSRKVREVLPKQEAPDPEDITTLTLPQARVLVNCPKVPEERRDLYLAALVTGLRAGELFGLQRVDLVLDDAPPTLRVRQQLAHARGSVGAGVRTESPKSRWSRRTLPVHAKLQARLLATTVDAPPDAFVFGDGTERPDSAELLRVDLEAAGLPTKVGDSPIVFHSLRHTFSTLLEGAGVPGDMIDRMLGQMPRTTRGRHYSRPDLEAMARAVAKIVLDDPGPDLVGSPPAGSAGTGQSPGELSHELSRERVHESAKTAQPLENTTKAPVAQRIEQRFPKPLVASSTLAGGARGLRVVSAST